VAFWKRRGESAGKSRPAGGSEPTGLGDLAPEEVLARVYLRVMGTPTLPEPWQSGHGYARELDGDLVEVLAVDLPESVTVLPTEDVERLGEDALRAAGRENLLREPIESHEVLAAPDGPAVHVVEGESFFTASKLLVLDDVLRRTIGERELPYGVLVSAPVRHLLAFHPIEDIGVIQAVNRMAAFTASVYSDGAGAVSPYVYWWRDGDLIQLTALDDDGQVHVVAGGEFTEVLNSLAARDG